MLNIDNLHVSIDNKKILNGINLNIKNQEIHVIMGPNGSGKSTLSSVISGKNEYKIDKGDIYFDNKNLLKLTPEEIAHNGIFLSFQYPIEIPGISMLNFIHASINAIRKANKLSIIKFADLLKDIKNILKIFKMKEEFLFRPLNYGFSGGEKKISEIIQMLILQPKLSILDEIDSGLDIDALRIVAHSIINFLKKNNKSILIITHYQRILEYITPNYVHILYKGKIIKSGDKNLAFLLEKKGYDWIKNENK